MSVAWVSAAAGGSLLIAQISPLWLTSRQRRRVAARSGGRDGGILPEKWAIL
jgi:hypothetical protein